MALSFPNLSRSYDMTRRAVRFWGHDSAMEASFFVSEEALRRIQPDMGLDEERILSAFDSNRDLICSVAATVYGRGHKGSYDLERADFSNTTAVVPGSFRRWLRFRRSKECREVENEETSGK
jgi:Protein of unknown function (DUF1488)